MTACTDATAKSNPKQRERAKYSEEIESTSSRLVGDLKANEYFTSRRIGRKRTKTKTYSPPSTDGPKRRNKLSNKRDGVQSTQREKKEKKTFPFTLPKRQVIFDVFEKFDTLCSKSIQPDEQKLQERIYIDWQSTLLAGFNILCYGFGSKVKLLKEFGENYVAESFVLQIHGYLKSVSIQYVCTFILEKIINYKRSSTSQSLEQTCQDIAMLQKSTSYPHTILIVHSLDGYALRNLELQRCLSILSTARFIHIIASIDHINSSSMWLESDLERYQWVYHQLDSESPYDQEIAWQSSTSQKESKQSFTGIRYILQSLAPKDVSILRCIARMQWAAATSTTRSTQVFAEYHKVYKEAAKKLLVRSYGAFNSIIKTLKDHGLVCHRQMRGIERLHIPFDDEHVIVEIFCSSEIGNT